MVWYVILAVGLIGLDQLVKAWVVANLAIGQTVTLIPHVISLTHIQNTGAAFSILEGQQWVFYIITIIALVVVAVLWRDSRGHLLYRIGLTLIFAGAIGNFIDRIRQQYVTDMFQVDFMNFAIFNVADACLTIGVIAVVIHLIFFDQQAKA
ncbi:signal peptidase II [Lacticaseibacillus nasuensis]|uniref:signal peptidase II n=1 Tax=Lacticaseibacillus nasuensis TaxID=944671 RepID=UPI0022464713|nr:signal peptidase II [Lacticaseibacillus nasuensis]MCX2454898.1 signal peptidase II [Lacticaseibacillus nasuensis]